MIELPIYDTAGTKVDTLKIDEQTLGGEIRHALLKQAYVITHGNQRQGSARTKSRGDVHGSTRKIYKQKGTGSARAGAARTAIRKGGGVTFTKTRTRVHSSRLKFYHDPSLEMTQEWIKHISSQGQVLQVESFLEH